MTRNLVHSLLLIPLLAAGGAFAGEETARPVLDLSTPVQDHARPDPARHRGLDTGAKAPEPAPATESLLERTGIDPDVRASETSVGATQRIELGTQTLPNEQTTLQPYLELGADAEKRGDAPMVSGTGVNADVTSSVGGGTRVQVNKRIDLNLGYTRQEPVGTTPSEREAEDKVQSGVTIKF